MGSCLCIIIQFLFALVAYSTVTALQCQKGIHKTAFGGIMEHKQPQGSVDCYPPYGGCATIVCDVISKFLSITIGTITIRDCVPVWLPHEFVAKQLCDAQTTDHWDMAKHVLEVKQKEFKVCNATDNCNKA